MLLTSKQKAEYIKNKGTKCPFCGSEDIEGDSFDVNEGKASQEMSCLDCEESWYDIYTLTGVIPR